MSIERATDMAELYIEPDLIGHRYREAPSKIYREIYRPLGSDPISYNEFMNVFDSLRCHYDSLYYKGVYYGRPFVDSESSPWYC